MYCKTANNQAELEVRARRVSELSEVDELHRGRGVEEVHGRTVKARGLRERGSTGILEGRSPENTLGELKLNY